MDEPILAIEGALGCFSIAVLRDGRLDAERLDGQSALEAGLGLIEALLARARVPLEAVGGIAVGTGPGSFTGLRIAIAFAKSLALGAARPLGGISSFDIVDAGANAESHLPRLTVVCGRAGIVCIRRTDPSGTRVACGPVAGAVARVTEAHDAPITIVGGTEDVRSAALERAASVHVVPAGHELPAAVLARVARARAPAASLHAIAPDYGEAPAVRIRS
jgi:tRNA threonylcarbamoyladenosine biosynthesis protein TsaB